MSRLKLPLFAFLMVFALATSAQALTINYAYVSSHDYDSLGQSVYDAIGQQTWVFTHASVGGNMLGGMDSLRSQDSSKYQLTTPSYSYTANAPDVPVPGSVYDLSRGNPGWANKYAIFEDVVTDKGWGAKADFAMDKLCYIDTGANAQTYIDMMVALEAQSQATLVWTTMPIKDSANSNAYAYNQAIRAYAAANNKLLFDIADLESYDSSGNQYTSGGMPVLYSGWTSDGGHLNSAGSQWIAKGWYSLAASQTPIPGAVWLLGTGLVGLVGLRKKFRG